MDASERRAHYRALFDSWLDRALAEDAAPSAIDAEILAALEDPAATPASPDLYTLFEALTALTQETKLQGRAFKALSESVGPLLSRVDEVASRHGEALSEARRLCEEAMAVARGLESDRVREAQERCVLESLDLLLDLRDRFTRGLTSAEALLARAKRRSRLLARLRGGSPPLAEAVKALLDGQRLTLDQLDQALRERGVSVIECLGRAFEPGSMSAVEVLETAEVADGTVVEVYRTGYEWNGSVLRPAQVKVARRRGGSGNE